MLIDQCIAAAHARGGRCPWRALPGSRLCDRHESSRRAQPTSRGGPAAEVGLADSVVYYLGDPSSQLVKIGTTKELRMRIKKIRQGRPRTLILATEPGGYELERRRHLEYRPWRAELGTGEKEWFHKAPLLMKHITTVRHQHGILCPGWPVSFSVIAPVRR